MLSRALRLLIYQGMPDTITVDDKIFNVAKRYANQYEGEVFPAVTLDYRNISEPKTPNLDRVRRKDIEFTETLRYTEPTSFTTIQIQGESKPVVPGPPGLDKGGYCFSSDHTDYATANAQTSGGCGVFGARTCDSFKVGQTQETGSWWIYRAHIYFDLTSLSPTVKLYAARFKFTPKSKQDGSDPFFNPIPLMLDNFPI